MKTVYFDINEELHDVPGLPTVLYGDYSDDLIVYVHGENGSKEDARRFAELACPRGYQVMAIDLTGHGENQSEFPVTLEQMEFDMKLLSAYLYHRCWNIFFRTDGYGAYLVIKELSDLSENAAMFYNPTLPDGAELPKEADEWGCAVSMLLPNNANIPDFIQSLDTEYTVECINEGTEKNSQLEYWESCQLEIWERVRKMRSSSKDRDILLQAATAAIENGTFIPTQYFQNIISHVKEISSNELLSVDRQLATERNGKTKIGGYEIDATDWTDFHTSIRAELISRGESPCKLRK